ncbi:MAG: restriction endonuclease subunit S [Chthoniobacterales bacterium]|nr:restriction endonuclease subunit S [Chthoniobacterales bacterium]
MKAEGRRLKDEWRIVALDKVATIERSAIQPDAISQGTAYLGLEHIESGGKILGAKPVDEGELASSKFQFTARHVLYGKLRPYLAKIACPDFTGICSTDILPILPGPDLERRFLCYFLRQPSMVDYANSRAAGANLPRLSPSALAAFAIPLPPLAEQRRIAEVLDRAEALRAKRRAALAQLNALTQSLFLDLFGDPVANRKGFPVSRMGDVCDVRDGTHDSPKYVSEGGYPLVTSKNLSGGFVDLSDVNLISEADYIQINKRSKVDRGDIIMPMIGTIGSPVLVEDEPRFAIKNVALIKFTAASPLPILVRHLLSCDYFDHIVGQKNRGGTQKFVSLGDLRSFPLPLPPIPLQREFARRVTAVEALKTAQRASLAELDALFATLQHRAFRGEL